VPQEPRGDQRWDAKHGRQSLGRVVHLELHTHDLSGASTFYRQLLGWRTESLHCRCGTYHGLGLGGTLDGGIVECSAARPIWLPYVQVGELEAITERGRALGAKVVLEPREGPAGWRSVLATSEAGEIALWQPKRSLVRESG
jgi:predicted enzyme related to lactoylglutathione lyase